MGYRRWLLGAYALFFAVIAPFICWGSVSDSTHAHAGSHFVFDEMIEATSVHSSESHGHDYCIHDPMLRHNRLAPERMAIASLPNTAFPNDGTRATPVVTLISLIMLLLVGVSETIIKLVRQIVRIHFFLPVKDVLLLVPIPPPRDCIVSGA